MAMPDVLNYSRPDPPTPSRVRFQRFLLLVVGLELTGFALAASLVLVFPDRWQGDPPPSSVEKMVRYGVGTIFFPGLIPLHFGLGEPVLVVMLGVTGPVAWALL